MLFQSVFNGILVFPNIVDHIVLSLDLFFLGQLLITVKPQVGIFAINISLTHIISVGLLLLFNGSLACPRSYALIWSMSTDSDPLFDRPKLP